ncbi:MAG TPA: hypothetical protein VMV18_12895 [bacterium]|nr:hypothetical protein [bacterium]
MPALLHVASGPPRDVFLFLFDAFPGHRGPERPSDLLSDGPAFFPVVNAKSGEFQLIARERVVAISAALECELIPGELPPEDLAGDDATKVNAEILLANGTRLSGMLVFLMPEGQRRLQDHLNETAAFLILRDGNTAHVIRKSQIIEVAQK